MTQTPPAERRRLFRTLFGRLAALYLVLLLAAVGTCLALAWWQAGRYVREVEQRVNAPLAATLARALAPEIAQGLDTPAARAAMARVQALHPAIDVYLLDDGGRIVAEFKQGGAPVRPRVGLGPVREFAGAAPRLPLFGDDPGSPDGQEVFSAAPVSYGDAGGTARPGTLYAVLRGMPHAMTADRVRESYVLRSLLVALAVAVAGAALGGLALFGALTGRFRALARAVERFRTGDFAARAPEAGGDEIARLARTFNAMAAQTQAHLGALEEADRSRRALAENVAHDFRATLVSTRAAAERLLGDDAGPDARRADARTVLADTGRLVALADQLAVLSDLDARRLAPVPEPFSAADLVQDVALRFRPEADRLGVALDGVHDGALAPVHGDIALVERTLANLIENALRHTPPGGRVQVSAETRPDSPLGVRIVVSDTGDGIDPDDLALVSRRFYRTRRSRERSLSGTGLGLAIAREFVELHGGTLGVASTVGVGTAVTLTLPTQAGLATAERARPSGAPTDGPRPTP